MTGKLVSRTEKSREGALLAPKPKRVVSYLTPSLHERLRKRCYEKDITFSSAMTTALEHWLKED